VIDPAVPKHAEFNRATDLSRVEQANEIVGSGEGCAIERQKQTAFAGMRPLPGCPVRECSRPA